MSAVETAGSLVRRAVEIEAKGWGDQANAVRRFGYRYGIPVNSLEHLRTGRAKTVEAGLFSRIRAAYLDLCERQIEKLQQQIAVEKAITEDGDLHDIEAETARLASRIAAAKGRR